MDITQFDLRGLQSLHVSFISVLKNHEKQLESLSKDDEFYELQFQNLLQKIDNFKNQISLIEQRIEELNKEQLRFSVEFFFWNYGTMRKNVQIHFLTTSNAYKTYGSYVTGVVHFEKEEFPELIKRVNDKKHSDGIIRFEETVSNRMTDETKKKLLEEGFYVSEIDRIY